MKPLIRRSTRPYTIMLLEDSELFILLLIPILSYMSCLFRRLPGTSPHFPINPSHCIDPRDQGPGPPVAMDMGRGCIGH